jgi:hypothetical protein
LALSVPGNAGAVRLAAAIGHGDNRKDDMDQHGNSPFAGNPLRAGHSPGSDRNRWRQKAFVVAATLATGAGLLGGASTAQAVVTDGGSGSLLTSSAFSTTSTTTAATTGAGSSAVTKAALSTTWPTAKGSVKVSSTTAVKTSFDGGLKRYYGIGDGSQSESQDPMFTVADGGTIKNVIIGTPAGDGIHCLGSCTIQNVWWEDVGEDAATQKGTKTGQVMTIDGGGAQKASDKIFQHNGPGTMVIKNFVAKDFGKLYRSCGNCSKQYQRTVIVQNVTVVAPGKLLAGVNTNYGDKATFTGITIQGDSSKKIHICDRFTGNSTGKEPTKTGTGADGKFCVFSSSDLTYK